MVSPLVFQLWALVIWVVSLHLLSLLFPITPALAEPSFDEK